MVGRDYKKYVNLTYSRFFLKLFSFSSWNFFKTWPLMTLGLEKVCLLTESKNKGLQYRPSPRVRMNE